MIVRRLVVVTYWARAGSAAAGRARSRLGADRGPPERHRRPVVRRHARTVMKLALEGAGFISAYDRTGSAGSGRRAAGRSTRRGAGVAVKQGVGVVLPASVDREERLDVALKAARGVTGNVIIDGGRHALPVRTTCSARRPRLATSVRTPSATNLRIGQTLRDGDAVGDVARRRPRYAKAMEALSKASSTSAAELRKARRELDPELRARLRRDGHRVAEHRPAAGCRELRQGGDPARGQHDGARAVPHARIYY